MLLNDGSVIPSFLSAEQATEESGGHGDDNMALKVGAVVRLYYPDDAENLNKKRIEYDVKVQERSGRSGFTVSLYKHCMVSDLFGGVADSFEFSLRPSTNPEQPTPLFQDGSTVLLLCLHGDTNFGTIVGGLRNSFREALASTARGHFLSFEFNGINVEINKDGELTLTYKSATNIAGTPKENASMTPPDLKTGGSVIKIDKTGSIEVTDNKNCAIRLDKPTGDITILTTGGDVVVYTNRDQVSHVGRDQTSTIGGDQHSVVSGSAMLSAKEDILHVAGGMYLAQSETVAKIQARLVELTYNTTSKKDGVITGQSVDPFTGVMHVDFSETVRAKK